MLNILHHQFTVESTVFFTRIHVKSDFLADTVDYSLLADKSYSPKLADSCFSAPSNTNPNQADCTRLLYFVAVLIGGRCTFPDINLCMDSGIKSSKYAKYNRRDFPRTINRKDEIFRRIYGGALALPALRKKRTKQSPAIDKAQLNLQATAKSEKVQLNYS